MTAQLAVHEAATPSRESRLVVPGISCAGCIAKIERELGRDAGIFAVRVRFSGKTVTVAHDSHLTAADLVERLSTLGFEAQPFTEGQPAKDKNATKDLLKRTAVAAFAAMNVMLLSVSIWSGADDATRELFHRVSALIALPAIAYAGRPFFASALTALTARRTNMDVPIAVGLLLVTGMSLYETLTGGPDAWFDGALMLLFFLLSGRVLDASMRNRAEDGIRSLLKQRPSGADVFLSDGGTVWRPVADLAPGMRMRVVPGDRLAADGVIEEGRGDVDASLLTGESAPLRVDAGDQLAAGVLNLDGVLKVKITRSGGDDTLGVMSGLMEAATQSKSAYVRFADRAARIYAPLVHLLALLAFAGWVIAGADWHQALLIATAVLIITCPCALGLAVPAAQVIACGRLVKQGILVKDGSALERLSDIDTVVFDKTGTLTEGRPVPQGLDRLSTSDREVLLGLASGSRHPLSRAITHKLQAEGVSPAPVNGICETAGSGLTGYSGGVAVALVKPERASDDQAQGTAVIFRRTGHPDGLIRFNDDLREDAAMAVEALRRRGLNVRLLSGDNPGAVKAVSECLGLTSQGGLLPGEKQAVVGEWRAQGQRVLMVGDGLNDGLALASADAGMAPSAASDVAQQAADIVYLGGVTAVPKAIETARRTMNVVRQNVGFAILYNACAVPLAIAGYVSPLAAAVAMSLSSAVVVANSARLARGGA